MRGSAVRFRETAPFPTPGASSKVATLPQTPVITGVLFHHVPWLSIDSLTRAGVTLGVTPRLGGRFRGNWKMALTDVEIRSAKAVDKPLKLFDGGGLFLLVNPNGSRWWRFKYRYEGKERGLSLGVYPDVTLKRARAGRDEARRLLVEGIDPSANRQADKQSRAVTFQAVAEEWLEQQAKKVAPITLSKARWMITEFVVPHIGSRPIHKITPAEVLAALRQIEARGRHETAHRTKQCVGQIFRYAVATSRAERDITADLRGALVAVSAKNHAAVTDAGGIGALLRAIDGYCGQPATHAALKLAPLVFVRPGELRQAEWCEINFEAAEWRIPARKMKMREVHIEDARGAHRAALTPSAEDPS